MFIILAQIIFSMKYLFTFLLLLVPCLQVISQDNLLLDNNDKLPENLLKKANEAYTLSNKGHYDSAINILKALLPLCNKQDYVLRSKIYNYLGIAYSFSGDMKTSIQSLLQAASLLEKSTEQHAYDLSAIYNNIAMALNRTGDNQEALNYLQKAENLALSGKEMKSLTPIYVNRGRIYKELMNWGKSLAEFKKSLFILDSLKRHDSLADLSAIRTSQQITHINMGQLFLDKQQYAEARQHGLAALKLKPDPINPYYHIPNVILLGSAYMGLGDYSLSEKYLKEAQQLSAQYNVLEGICESAYTLSNLYAYTGRYQQALERYRLYKKYDDSIRSLDKMNSVKNMEIKYRVAQKDREIMATRLKTLEQERTIKNRNFSILLISSLSLLVIAILIFISKSYRQREKLRKRDLQASIQDKKISVMKAMIEGEEKERSRMAEVLHDGIGSIISAAKMNFSTAHSAEMPNKNMYENGLSLLDEAAKEIRNTAHNLMPEKLLIDGLEEAVTTYCKRISNKEALDIDYEFNGTFEALDKGTALLVYRTVQELINNILKHASATKVFVQVNYVDGLLNLAVEDNGKGMNHENISEENTGMGLKTIREKINAMNGTITIHSASGKGTQVYIDLDC